MVLHKGLQPMVRKQASNNSSSPYTSWLLTPFLFLKSFFVLQKSGHSLQFTEILSPLSFNKSQILFRNWFLMFLCLFLISGKIIEELSPHFLPWKENCWKRFMEKITWHKKNIKRSCYLKLSKWRHRTKVLLTWEIS